MFSDTDVHYIAAFLYAAGGKPASVTLGQKVRDAAAKEDRDVDIAMMSTGQIGIVAAEVKNHRRPLDVTVVEQLCRKLSDMPSIRSRAIVSASGYTAPARRKAARHRVKCLTLKRGPLHVFKTVNLPRLTHVKVDDTAWIDGPHISFSFSTDEPLTTAEQAQLRGRKRFNFESFSLTAEEVKQQMREQFDLGALNLIRPRLSRLMSRRPWLSRRSLRSGVDRSVSLPRGLRASRKDRCTAYRCHLVAISQTNTTNPLRPRSSSSSATGSSE